MPRAIYASYSCYERQIALPAMLLIIHNSILIGFAELGTWHFPYTGDHNAYCLIKTQLHGSKTLRREKLKLESYFDVIQSSVSARKVRTFSSYIWIVHVLVRGEPCQVYLRETLLYPLHGRDKERTQLRGTLTEVSVHDL